MPQQQDAGWGGMPQQQDAGFSGPQGGKRSASVLLSEEWYTGNVTTLGSKFGFIQCAEVYASCGMDVFMPAWQGNGLSVGDTVTFQVAASSKGQPQAHNISLADGSKKRRLSE